MGGWLTIDPSDQTLSMITQMLHGLHRHMNNSPSCHVWVRAIFSSLKFSPLYSLHSLCLLTPLCSGLKQKFELIATNYSTIKLKVRCTNAAATAEVFSSRFFSEGDFNGSLIRQVTQQTSEIIKSIPMLHSCSPYRI